MPRGLFITLEGLDGSGKTTQINRLAAWLKKHAADTPQNAGTSSLRRSSGQRAGSNGLVLTRQPGGTPTGDRIRALLLDSRATALSPMTEMALMFADRAQTIAEVIEPALKAGKIVVCDRFTDSTEAYQGGGRRLGSATVLELHRLLCSNLQPDLTLMLLPSLEASLARARRRNQRTEAETGQNENRFEQEQDEFYRRVWEKYKEIAAREPQRVVLIEGDLSIDAIHEKIVAAVSELLSKTSQPG